MNSQLKTIQPIIPPITVIYTNVLITCTSVVLNTQATFSVLLSDDSEKYVLNKNFIMSGQDYQNWTSDDYVYNWINQQLQNNI